MFKCVIKKSFDNNTKPMFIIWLWRREKLQLVFVSPLKPLFPAAEKNVCKGDLKQRLSPKEPTKIESDPAPPRPPSHMGGHRHLPPLPTFPPPTGPYGGPQAQTGAWVGGKNIKPEPAQCANTVQGVQDEHGSSKTYLNSVYTYITLCCATMCSVQCSCTPTGTRFN